MGLFNWFSLELLPPRLPQASRVYASRAQEPSRAASFVAICEPMQAEERCGKASLISRPRAWTRADEQTHRLFRRGAHARRKMAIFGGVERESQGQRARHRDNHEEHPADPYVAHVSCGARFVCPRRASPPDLTEACRVSACAASRTSAHEPRTQEQTADAMANAGPGRPWTNDQPNACRCV